MNSRKIILPLLVILIALGLTLILVNSRKVPKPHETEYLGPLVEVAEVVETSRTVTVRGTGTVQPRYEVNITPQVRGQVIEISPSMVVGGAFSKGDLLFVIDPLDYRLAIELARASLAQAKLEMLRIENLAKVARREWQALNTNADTEPDPLVVYKPQLESARAQKGAAEANLEQAELNLRRTKIYAPFDCYVRSEQLEIGQYLNAGSPVATLVGSGHAEVVLPLSLDDLAWLDVPREGLAMTGSAAQLKLQSGADVYVWPGQITRALGEIDPRSRMASVVVTVSETRSGQGQEGKLLSDLMPGMFVEVVLQGQELSGVIAVPRGALHDRDTVWTVDEDNRLHIREVDIIRRQRDEVLVRSGIKAGDKIVLTNISAAAEGMVLRPRQQETAK